MAKKNPDPRKANPMTVVLVRNTSKSPLIVPVDGAAPLVFAPSGDSGGGDIIPIDSSIADSASLYRAFNRGYLIRTTGEDDAADQAQIAQIAAERQRTQIAAQEAKARQVEATIDRKQDRDLIGKTCVAPSSANPNLPCGVSVIRPSVASGDAPPLCSAHESQSSNYVAVEDEADNQSSATVKTRWVRAGIDRTARSL